MDRNAVVDVLPERDLLSLSARRAWIEMAIAAATPGNVFVALRKESVDRNISYTTSMILYPVALRKESVDRNFINVARAADRVLSLSARRAWIEIVHPD